MAVILGLSAVGLFAHELVHFLFGSIFGGSAFFSRYWLGIPTQVDFRTPHEMSDRQVQIVAGGVLFSPCIALLDAYFRSIPLLAFGAGGAGVSATDMIGFQYPEVWKDFTAGESVNWGDFE